MKGVCSFPWAEKARAETGFSLPAAVPQTHQPRDPHHYPDSILPGRLESSFVPQNIPAPREAASLLACEEAAEGHGGYRSPSASAKSAVKTGQTTKTFWHAGTALSDRFQLRIYSEMPHPPRLFLILEILVSF